MTVVISTRSRLNIQRMHVCALVPRSAMLYQFQYNTFEDFFVSMSAQNHSFDFFVNNFDVMRSMCCTYSWMGKNRLKCVQKCLTNGDKWLCSCVYVFFMTTTLFLFIFQSFNLFPIDNVRSFAHACVGGEMNDVQSGIIISRHKQHQIKINIFVVDYLD